MMKRTRNTALAALAFGAAWSTGCLPTDSQLTLPDASAGYKNTTDPTNGGARYVGSSACAQCHADIASAANISGHAWAFSRSEGRTPQFPAQASRAAVPNPPDGFDWTDISYVHGGYLKGAIFVDQNGFMVTTGLTGVATQWNLDLPANRTRAGFVDFAPDATTPLPYGFDCFRCHTTGARQADPAAPQFQDGRPGIAGGWAEPGVQCEACHGPGGGHFTTQGTSVVINRARIFIDPDGTQSCRTCHSSHEDESVIAARDGYIAHGEQWSELRASGGHASFACTICHDPHHSATYDRAPAIRNTCMKCHTTATMAGHEGAVFRRGDYVEPLTCESCHMPFAQRTASTAVQEAVDPVGRIGDTRSHIFRISTQPVDYTGMFTADGSQVVLDSRGRAAVTVDFVCLRCHNDSGVPLFRPGPPGREVSRAAEIAPHVHELP